MKFSFLTIFTFLVILLFPAACSSFQPVKERTQVNLRGPTFELGTVDAQFNKYLIPGLLKNDITVSYYPDDDVVCMSFRHNFTNHYLFWSGKNRPVFINALTEYKQAYEERNLPAGNRRTKRAYGTVRGFAIWESTKFSMQGTSHPNVDIGYQFANKMPYFTITQNEAPNENQVTKEALPKNSAITIFFTRSQADALVALFNSDIIRNFSNTPDTASNDPDIEEFF